MDQSEFQFNCFRKHLLRDKKYLVQIKTNEVMIGQKYKINLKDDQTIKWKTIDNKLIAYGFHFQQTFKWFYADQYDLCQLRNHLRRVITFSNYQDFYNDVRILFVQKQSKIIMVKDKFTKETRISKRGLKKGEDRTQLYNELFFLRIIDHPYIVKAYEFFEGENTLEIIEEYYEKGTLANYLQKNPELDQETIKNFMKQLLKALQYLEKRGIIHRDLKPDNIMITEDLSLKIIDFGLATIGYQMEICGTIGYMAPEIINKQYYTTKSDIFSAGCIFYELQQNLTSQYLYPYSSEYKTYKANKKGDINLDILKIYKTVTPDMLDLIKQMLHFDQKKRISANDALNHQFFSQCKIDSSKRILSTMMLTKKTFQEDEFPREGQIQKLHQSMIPNAKNKSQ